jgi:hypothetical protein
VWKRTVEGRVLNFRLAGINNQNFLMRDRETGTWWQQVTGKAVFGPLKGKVLDFISSDELTFGLWKSEAPAGQVLAPVIADQKEYDSDWEPKIAKTKVVVSFPENGMNDRDVVMGVELAGAARAYPAATILSQSPVQDRIGGTPVLLVVGPDGKSIRAFISRLEGSDVEFFKKTQTSDWGLVDTNGNEWNFRGCAVSGSATGKCLEPVPLLKDYWFDWRNYHPGTSVYRH